MNPRKGRNSMPKAVHPLVLCGDKLRCLMEPGEDGGGLDSRLKQVPPHVLRIPRWRPEVGVASSDMECMSGPSAETPYIY